jgi:hypothetical protein
MKSTVYLVKTDQAAKTRIVDEKNAGFEVRKERL